MGIGKWRVRLDYSKLCLDLTLRKPMREIKMDEDVDIDVCMGCGRYYSCTKSLSDRWRAFYKPKAGEVMPQLCYKCLFFDESQPLANS
jgi:hypothetical protein